MQSGRHLWFSKMPDWQQCSACCRPPLARVLTLIAFKLTSVAISSLGLSVSYARDSRLWCWDCALSQRERQLPSTATG
jgi:hypothetical protein